MDTYAKTYWATIFIAGSYEEAKQVCREWCMTTPYCVTVEPTTYIYTGGEETGVRVGLINYARFPTNESEILSHAFYLANLLRRRLCQWSYTIQTPDETYFDTKRIEE